MCDFVKIIKGQVQKAKERFEGPAVTAKLMELRIAAYRLGGSVEVQDLITYINYEIHVEKCKANAAVVEPAADNDDDSTTTPAVRGFNAPLPLQVVRMHLRYARKAADDAVRYLEDHFGDNPSEERALQAIVNVHETTKNFVNVEEINKIHHALRANGFGSDSVDGSAYNEAVRDGLKRLRETSLAAERIQTGLNDKEVKAKKPKKAKKATDDVA